MSNDNKTKTVFIKDSYRPAVDEKSYTPTTNPKNSYIPTTSQGETAPPMPKKK